MKHKHMTMKFKQYYLKCYFSESAVTYKIKTQELIVAVHLHDLLMVTRVTYMNDFKSIYT